MKQRLNRNVVVNRCGETGENDIDPSPTKIVDLLGKYVLRADLNGNAGIHPLHPSNDVRDDGEQLRLVAGDANVAVRYAECLDALDALSQLVERRYAELDEHLSEVREFGAPRPSIEKLLTDRMFEIAYRS